MGKENITKIKDIKSHLKDDSEEIIQWEVKFSKEIDRFKVF